MPHRVEPMRPAYFRRVVIDMILRGGPVSRMQQVATTRHDVNGESSERLPQASKTSSDISLHIYAGAAGVGMKLAGNKLK